MWQQVVRQTFRREAIPPRALWWLAIDGMSGWNRMLLRGLSEPLGGKEVARETIARLVAPVFQRRYGLLRRRFAHLPDPVLEPSAVGLLMGALYRVRAGDPGAWVLAGVGGAARSRSEQIEAGLLLRPLSARDRWDELATHLGEQLIALTHGLPGAGLAATNAVLGKLCFEGGASYAGRIKKTFRLSDSPESAVEVLRMSEFIFQVNPHHWHRTDDQGGFLEGTACPWYTAPGWSMMHCGVFGQFQSGISSVFGLRYQLTRTIPKHGGHTCRIDLKPIQLRRSSREGPVSA